jgi:hypothetical protein
MFIHACANQHGDAQGLGALYADSRFDARQSIVYANEKAVVRCILRPLLL